MLVKNKFIKQLATIIVNQVINDYEGIDGKRYKYITMDIKSQDNMYKLIRDSPYLSIEQAVKDNLEEFELFGITIDKYGEVIYSGITVNYIK